MMALERYYSWADTMRQQVTDLYDPEPRVHWEPYMAYWYGGLNAAVDGWYALKFRDARIGTMLTDQKKRTFLRSYRNAVFHFSRDYFDKRVIAMWEHDEVIEWADALHRRFGQWIREELPKIVESTFPHQSGGRSDGQTR